ncbi:MAG: hypothetical protein M1830_009019 [Pleopsidium flavum]|nr:MAG: hypothetical protein M1830_009019 [Pleopsidium flavum]
MAEHAWSRIAAHLITAFTGLLCYASDLAAAAPFSSSCSCIPAPTVPGAQILSIIGTEAYNVTSSAVPPFFPDLITGLDVCNVTVYLTHPGLNDRVLVQLFLPLTIWNGRFQATGGGGWATSFSEIALARAAADQYAAARTDGGHVDDFPDPSSWALLPNGSVNQGLLTNFASRSLHDMAVVGKAVTESYYGKKVAYSYWNGCSTGGRQGLMEAQRYPDDFDGIVAAAPAINWPSFLVADQWPQVVMGEEGQFPSQCEFQAFQNANVVECDALDGVVDGVIGDVGGCKSDPYELVGSSVLCDGVNTTISKTAAGIVRKILDGPTTANGTRLWWGLKPGTDFSILANTTTVNGSRVGVPFPVSDSWIRYFLEENPNYNTSLITYSKFRQLFAQSNVEYNDVIGTNDANLSRFRAAGGKMITWHGLADNLILPDGTINYYQQVEEAIGKNRTSDFYRLFLAPGAGHCVSSAGPVPTDPLGALVAWVENGTVPETLPAEMVGPGNATLTRNICRYPLVSRYDGEGDPDSASSYTCATSFG